MTLFCEVDAKPKVGSEILVVQVFGRWIGLETVLFGGRHALYRTFDLGCEPWSDSCVIWCELEGDCGGYRGLS